MIRAGESGAASGHERFSKPAGMMDVMDSTSVMTAPLLSIDGSRTTLRDELGPRATVVVFVRHYG